MLKSPKNSYLILFLNEAGSASSRVCDQIFFLDLLSVILQFLSVAAIFPSAIFFQFMATTPDVLNVNYLTVVLWTLSKIHK